MHVRMCVYMCMCVQYTCILVSVSVEIRSQCQFSCFIIPLDSPLILELAVSARLVVKEDPGFLFLAPSVGFTEVHDHIQFYIGDGALT